MQPVLTKQDFVRRYKASEFGNAAPTWDSFHDFYWRKEVYAGMVHIRNRVIGGYTLYNVPDYDVGDEVTRINREGLAHPNDLYFSGMAPHEHGTIQGEVQRTERGLYLYYNLQKIPMREGFKVEQLHAWGLTAKLLLQRYLNEKSYEWLEYLLDTYEGHVVEFSAFNTCWGTIPGYNTVWWECRLY